MAMKQAHIRKPAGSTPSILDPDLQICRSLYSATNALIRAYRPLLDPLGLTYPQYLVMLALWEKDAVTVTRICQRTRLETGTVTPILKRLEAKGLITRGRSTADERRRVIELTRSGEALKALAESVPTEMACMALLTPEQGLELQRLAETLYERLTDLQATN